MIKLYRFAQTQKEYWEAWRNDDGSCTVHWGELGTRGQSKIVKGSIFKSVDIIVRKEEGEMKRNGFQEIDEEETLIIEFNIEGMGTDQDLKKRHNLQDRMDETLGWTGLGHCDGGSIGSGTMEICNIVVDFKTARKVIEDDLKGTEFGDYARIYCEEE